MPLVFRRDADRGLVAMEARSRGVIEGEEMIDSEPSAPDSMVGLRRYLVVSVVLHFVWEVVQLPLYTIWAEPVARQAFAVLHCTVGDLMIAALSLLAALSFAGRRDWPWSGSRAVWLLLLPFGAGYTIYSEWLNVSVRGDWAYSPLMPTLPLIGTGLSPFMQWLIIPTAAVRLAAGRWPWKARKAGS